MNILMLSIIENIQPREIGMKMKLSCSPGLSQPTLRKEESKLQTSHQLIGKMLLN